MTTKELLITAWDRGVFVPLLCVAALFAYGLRVRWRVEARAVFFVIATSVFFLALASPIGVLARGVLFSAHMLQHLLLVLVVPPLVLQSLPREPAIERVARHKTVTRGSLGLWVPWLAGVFAMWVWHAPAFCNAAAVSPAVGWLQTTSLIGMGLLFWRPILAPRTSDRAPAFAAIFYLFTACVACTVLGIMVTLSPVEVCSAYRNPADSQGALPLLREGWGLTCRADQELGGLMMWMPTCFVYGGAILAALGRYYAEERQAHGSDGYAQ